jgi:hypothetical protein
MLKERYMFLPFIPVKEEFAKGLVDQSVNQCCLPFQLYGS